MRRRLPVLVILAALAALVAGCGDDESTSSPLDDVEVTLHEGESPTLEFDQPFATTETETRLVEEGDGEEIAANAIVTFDYVIVNGRDGTELSTSYGAQPAEVVFEDSLMAGIYDGLDGVPSGSQVLVAIAPEDGLGPDPSTGVEEDDTLLFFAEIRGVRTPLERAAGEEVPAVEGLPTVVLADDGTPTITVPDADPPTELVVQPLIEGEGAEVETGQSVTVHYLGVHWATNEVLDSSWSDGVPTTFDIGTGSVIPGWDEGLVGQAVGSQVLLVVPPDQGYPDGSPDGVVKPGETLVFVVDILDAV